MGENESRINIAIAGGPCTGKSTLSAVLFARLKLTGYDYDLIGEEYRRLKTEFGQYEFPAERCYMWLQQDREEIRSNARDGFVTDTPLFHLYVSARMYTRSGKDKMIIRELWRRSVEAADERYSLIALAGNPTEFNYKADQVRSAGEDSAVKRHHLIRSFVEHHFPDRLVIVNGAPDDRAEQIIARLKLLKKPAGS